MRYVQRCFFVRLMCKADGEGQRHTARYVEYEVYLKSCR